MNIVKKIRGEWYVETQLTAGSKDVACAHCELPDCVGDDGDVMPCLDNLLTPAEAKKTYLRRLSDDK